MADIGLSRKIAEASNNAKLLGLIPYIDPKSFNNRNQSYKLSKKSDVYSVGVLMWQISSGYKPFDYKNYDIGLAVSILDGLREKIIDGTPVEYKNLYTSNYNYNNT